MKKRRKEFPGATAYFDRHGRRRWRYRSKGFSAELGADYGSDEFVRRFEAALSAQRLPGRVGISRTRPGSLGALVAAWKQSPDYRGWAPLTQATYGGVAEKLRERHGDKLVAHLETRHVQKLMAEKADTPTAANRVRKTLGMLLAHAVALGWRNDNPARAANPTR